MTVIDQLRDALRLARVDWLITVPASGVSAVYRDFERRNACVFATREEEAIGIACGLTLAGASVAVLMQQSGVGNCLNAVFSLAESYQISFPVIVCDRTTADPNPVQRRSSRRTGDVLSTLGAADFPVNQPISSEAILAELQRKTRWIPLGVPGKE